MEWLIKRIGATPSNDALLAGLQRAHLDARRALHANGAIVERQTTVRTTPFAASAV